MTKGLRFTDNNFRKMLILALFFTFYLTTTWNRSIDVLPENVNLQTVMPQPDREVEQLWGRPEKIIPFNERKADNEIRYASFGSSVTWGAGLGDR